MSVSWKRTRKKSEKKWDVQTAGQKKGISREKTKVSWWGMNEQKRRGLNYTDKVGET